MYLFPAKELLVVVDALLGEHGAALGAAAQGVGIEGAAAFAGWWQLPVAAEVHSPCFPAAVAVERPLPVEAHAVTPLELMPAPAASQSVYSTHDSIKY